MPSNRQHAHDLLEQLDPSQLDAVERLLEVITDPLAHSLANAAVEEEEINEETARELADSRASLERGEGISHEEIMREFGLTPRA